jgi:hypothetical protein
MALTVAAQTRLQKPVRRALSKQNSDTLMSVSKAAGRRLAAPRWRILGFAGAGDCLLLDYASIAVEVTVLEVPNSVLVSGFGPAPRRSLARCRRAPPCQTHAFEGTVIPHTALVPHPPENFPGTIGFPGAPSAVTRCLEGAFTSPCLILTVEFT